MSTGSSGRPAAKGAGAFELAGKGDVEMLARIIAEVHELIVTGERRTARDRRNGQRRQRQDWSKVTHERRSGDDRRGGGYVKAEPRREAKQTVGNDGKKDGEGRIKTEKGKEEGRNGERKERAEGQERRNRRTWRRSNGA